MALEVGERIGLYHRGHGELAERPGDRCGNRRLGQRFIACQLLVQQRISRQQLPGNALKPRRMQFFSGAKVVFIDDLHAFFTGRQREPKQLQVAGACSRLLGQQLLVSRRQRFQVIEDQTRIHQHRAVVQHQGRGLDYGVDLGKFSVSAEHRQRFMHKVHPV